MSATEDGVQRIHLTGSDPATNLQKAYRHLKTSIHWSKRVFGVKDAAEFTMELVGPYMVDLARDLTHFSTYYPHVYFHLVEETSAGVSESIFFRGQKVRADG